MEANTSEGPGLGGAALEVRIDGPGHTTHTYRLPTDGKRARMPVHLDRGVNRFVVKYVGSTATQVNPLEFEPESQVAMTFSNLRIAGG